MKSLLAVTILAALTAQTPSPAPPAFEVASIKPNKSVDTRVLFRIEPGGRFVATNATLRQIISTSYQNSYQLFQILGGVGWMDSERFNIEAKAAGSASNAAVSEVLAMLRTLLADRFQLRIREDTRELAGFALINARADGTLTPQLRPSPGNCVVAQFLRDGSAAPVDLNGPPTCGMRFARVPSGLRITAVGRTMAQLATTLQLYVQRTVVDQTGLTGMFDFAFEFLPDGPNPAGNEPPSEPGVSVFTAVGEQLGLKLDSQRRPTKVLVIDSAERPSEN